MPCSHGPILDFLFQRQGFMVSAEPIPVDVSGVMHRDRTYGLSTLAPGLRGPSHVHPGASGGSQAGDHPGSTIAAVFAPHQPNRGNRPRRHDWGDEESSHPARGFA
jgi:hypothetical protein